MSPKARKRREIFLILFLAFFLRVWGIGFGLPYLYHADEPIVVNHALAYGSGDFNPHFFKIPPLVSYLVFICYGIFYLLGRGVGIFKSLADFEGLFLHDPTFFYLLARLIFGAVLGTASVWLLYQLIRRHFSEKLAVVTASFFAVAFLHVRDSHYIYLDIPLLFVMIAFFFLAFRIAEERGNFRQNHLAAGALVGLAVATKYNGVVLTVPYVLSSFLAPRKGNRWLGGMLAALGAAFAYTILNPFTWLDIHTFWREITQQASATGRTGFLHPLTYSLNGGIGPIALTVAVGGFGMGFWKREKKRLILLSFLISYYFLLAMKSQPYDRYALPLVPFALFFAGDFSIKLAGKFPKKSRNAWLGFLVFVTAFPPFAKSILTDKIFTQKDLRTEMKEWVEAAIPAGSRLALDAKFFMPGLRFQETQLLEKIRAAESDPHFSKAKMKRLESLLSQERSEPKGYTLYFLSQEEGGENFLFSQPKIPYDLDELKKHKIDYVLIARIERDYRPASFYESLKRSAKLVKRFSPYKNQERDFPFDTLPLTGGPFLWKELVHRERNGQPMEVYQLR